MLDSFLSALFWSTFDGPYTNKEISIRYDEISGRKVSVCRLIGKNYEPDFDWFKVLKNF